MKTKLITREGYNKLKQELDFLWREAPRDHPQSGLGGQPR